MRYVVICYLFPAEVLKVVISFQVACLFMTHLLSFMLHFCIKPCWIMIVARNWLFELNSLHSLDSLMFTMGCSFPSAILNIISGSLQWGYDPGQAFRITTILLARINFVARNLGSHSHLCPALNSLKDVQTPESQQKPRAKGLTSVLALLLTTTENE